MKQRARGGRGDQREGVTGRRKREKGVREVVHTGYDDITVCMAVASVVIQRGRFAGDPGCAQQVEGELSVEGTSAAVGGGWRTRDGGRGGKGREGSET